MLNMKAFVSLYNFSNFLPYFKGTLRCDVGWTSEIYILPGERGKKEAMANAVSENVKNWRGKLEEALDKKNAFTDLLEKIEQKTGVKRIYVVIGECAAVPHCSVALAVHICSGSG